MKISTQQTRTNIDRVTGLLAATPDRLQAVSSGLTPAQLAEPLAAGEWSLIEIMAHLVSCEAVVTQAITAALLVDEPVLPAVHPQRQWAGLLPYTTFPFPQLLGYFHFRRQLLLRLLAPLPEGEWGKSVTRAGKRPETVYRLARSLALHEADHLVALEATFTPSNQEK